MMKIPNNILKIILSTGLLFFNVLLVNGQIANDQDCTCLEETISDQSVLLSIGEDAYPNFLNISSLRKYSNVNFDDVKDLSRNFNTYTLKGSSKKAELRATYHKKDGSLINGHYITENTYLPKVILIALVEDRKGWTMTSNKTIVHDFDAQRTEYEVKMRKENNKLTLYFDQSGKPIKKLSRV